MIAPSFYTIMRTVGEDGLTGYQRRARTRIENALKKDPDYMKKWSQKSLQTMGEIGLKKRGQAIKASLINNGTMESRTLNSAAARRQTPVEEAKLLKQYRNRVGTLSRKLDLSDLPNFDKWGKGYDLDHKYSVSAGWKNKVPPEVIALKLNLQFIPTIENIKKGSKCVITLEELLCVA